MKRVQKGHVTLKWYVVVLNVQLRRRFRVSAFLPVQKPIVSRRFLLFHANILQLGSWRPTKVPIHVGAILPRGERNCVGPDEE